MEPMVLQAHAIFDALDFRTPAIVTAVDRLSEGQLWWQPPNGANSIGWLLWHIPEVEDNWIRDKLLHLPKRYPFGVSIKDRPNDLRPTKEKLVAYFREVRLLTAQRLEDMSDDDFNATIVDEQFGMLTVRRMWAGVASSCAWHGGQIIFIANRLLPRVERAQ
jgi:hypothetical protein